MTNCTRINKPKKKKTHECAAHGNTTDMVYQYLELTLQGTYGHPGGY